MPKWQSSTRRDRLPADWTKRRKRILKRDQHACQTPDSLGEKCREPATEVDHIRPGDDHGDHNLEAICTWHHKAKSSSEGGAARAKAQAKIDQSYRRTEEHPGLL